MSHHNQSNPMFNGQFPNAQFQNQPFGFNAFDGINPQAQMRSQQAFAFNPHQNPPFSQIHYSQNDDIVNRKSQLSMENYMILESHSQDDDVNEMYFAQPHVVHSLFKPQLSSNGKWFNDTVYAIFNAQDVLILTTPSVTMQVTWDRISINYGDFDVELNESQVVDGLIPILTVIYELHSEQESIKRDIELERLAEVARREELIKIRDKHIHDISSNRLFRDLDNSKNRGVEGQAKKNTQGEITKFVNRLEGSYLQLSTLKASTIIEKLCLHENKCLIWKSDNSDEMGVLYLDRGEGYDDCLLTMVCGDLKLDYSHSQSLIVNELSYTDLTDTSLITSLNHLSEMLDDVINDNLYFGEEGGDE